MGLIRTFISHTKSNCLTPADLSNRIEQLSTDAFKHRYRMFLELLVPVLDEWDKALRAENGIDFEDMLRGECARRS